MTLNYIQTCDIIPKLIKGNKELFYNEILNSKENLKSFLEKDSYLKACDKLKIDSSYNLTIESIDERNFDNTRVFYITFFDNYLMGVEDSKAIILALNKGSLRYYRVNSEMVLLEIDLEDFSENRLIQFENLEEEKIISYILEKLNTGYLKVPVGISARHVHLTLEDFEVLFGKGAELDVAFNLSQKGQFASNQKVTIKTDAAEFANVRILGPLRKYTQIEISRTDAFKLKINPPVRDSGNVLGSAGITIVGPKGELKKEYGCILANRHIHLTADDLVKYNLDADKIYKVKVKGEKGGVLDDVHLKVDPSFTFELHIDTDDANAFLIENGQELEIIK